MLTTTASSTRHRRLPKSTRVARCFSSLQAFLTPWVSFPCFFSSENKFFNKHVFVGSTGMTLCQITFKSSTKTGVLSSKNFLQSSFPVASNPSILSGKPSNFIILLMRVVMATAFVVTCVLLVLMVTCLFLWYLQSQVYPIKAVTVPRLELTAAVLAARCSVMLEKEFKFGCSVPSLCSY